MGIYSYRGGGGGGGGGREGLTNYSFFLACSYIHIIICLLDPFKFFSITSIICQTPEEGGEVYIYTESEGI